MAHAARDLGRRPARLLGAAVRQPGARLSRAARSEPSAPAPGWSVRCSPSWRPAWPPATSAGRSVRCRNRYRRNSNACEPNSASPGDDGVVAKCLVLWAALVGAISLEVFGQYGADTFTDPGRRVRHPGGCCSTATPADARIRTRSSHARRAGDILDAMHDQTPVQIAWVTRDLDATESALTDLLGAKKWVRMPDVHFGPGLVHLPRAARRLRRRHLVQLCRRHPTRTDRPGDAATASTREFLDRAGPGLHHICVEAADAERSPPRWRRRTQTARPS